MKHSNQCIATNCGNDNEKDLTSHYQYLQHANSSRTIHREPNLGRRLGGGSSSGTWGGCLVVGAAVVVVVRALRAAEAGRRVTVAASNAVTHAHHARVHGARHAVVVLGVELRLGVHWKIKSTTSS